MPMSSGGILRYSILIEAIDKATGRLGTIRNAALATQKALAFPETGVSNQMRSTISTYGQLSSAVQRYNTTVYDTLKQSKHGFLADIYKAQALDAQEGMMKLQDVSKKVGSLFETVSTKNLQAINAPMKAFKAQSNNFLGNLRDNLSASGYTDAIKEFKQARGEVSEFFNMMKRAPVAERGMYANIFERMSSMVSNISNPDVRTALEQGFQQAFGGSLSEISGMSRTEKAMLKNLVPFSEMQAEIDRTSEKWSKLNMQFENSKRQIQGLAVVFAQLGNSMSHAMMATKPLAEAIAFSGNNNISRTPFSSTEMGVSAGEMGQFYRGAARSPYESDLVNSQRQIMNYTKMFNQQVEQFIPVVSGMQTIFGDSMSMQQKLMTITGASMKSNVDFSGWFTLYMQGAIPQMASLQNGLNETLSIVGALSNQGLGAFAGFGVSSALQALIKPSAKSQELQAAHGMDLGKIIRTKGIIEAFDEINESLNSLTNKQRLEAMAQLFPGMGTGVIEILLKSTDNAKKLNREMSSMMEVNRANIEASKHGYYQLMQLSTTWGNALTGFLYNVSNTSAFKGLTRALTEPAEGLTRMQDAGMGKTSLLGELGAGLASQVGIGIAGMGVFRSIGFRQQMAMAEYQHNVARYAQDMMFMSQAEGAGISQGMAYQQGKGAIGMPFMATKAGGVIAGTAQTLTVLAGIYLATKTISNALKDYSERRNKEMYVDPITKLSIADFDKGRTDKDELAKIRLSIEAAKNALEMNTRAVKGSSKQPRLFGDSLSSYKALDAISSGGAW
jgi:hypothetical protein